MSDPRAMTARDEAISELHEALHMNMGRIDCEMARTAAQVCIDHLLNGPAPKDLLVRLAIEQGALEVDHERYIIRRGRSELLSLYRVVEP